MESESRRSAFKPVKPQRNKMSEHQWQNWNKMTEYLSSVGNPMISLDILDAGL